jgi:hypothetical protein
MRVHNIDVRSRMKQFLFLLAVTAVGMIISAALFSTTKIQKSKSYIPASSEKMVSAK